MNYRLIATEVGELLKWDTSLKQIDRIGRALFQFSKDTFPNESITSQRAQLIYDWILTLGRQEMQNDRRNEMLLEFCQKISPTDELLNRVNTTLSFSGIQSKKRPVEDPIVSTARRECNHRAKQLGELVQAFMSFTTSEPQRRGFQLQTILTQLFKIENIEVTQSFTRNHGAEQIDGAFRLDGWFYIVECRWRAKLADIRQVDGLKGQVDRSGKQALGVFLSMEGWSTNVPDLLKQNPEKSIFLMDGFDLMCVLQNQIPLKHLLWAKNSKLTLECRPFFGALEYQKSIASS